MVTLHLFDSRHKNCISIRCTVFQMFNCSFHFHAVRSEIQLHKHVSFVTKSDEADAKLWAECIISRRGREGGR